VSASGAAKANLDWLEKHSWQKFGVIESEHLNLLSQQSLWVKLSNAQVCPKQVVDCDCAALGATKLEIMGKAKIVFKPTFRIISRRVNVPK
jgi:hypothetical protein